MKIKSLYISAFGGIKNLTLNFDDGFNIIYGDNEDGKSTVMAFIKMMFYGSERGSAQISKNIRKKYTPWDGSPMAGSIDFEQNGKPYRLEREFRSSNSTDRVTLCDINLGTRQSVDGDIGTKIFGLSAAAFERSVFIGQFGYPDSDSAAESEINSKLSNIALTGDEKVSYDTVMTRLTKARTALMSKSGKAGILDKNIKLFGELKSLSEKAAEAKEEQNRKRNRISLLQQETEALAKKSELVKNKLSSEQDIRNSHKLKEYLSLKAELDGVNATLKLRDGSPLDEKFIQMLQFCMSKADSATRAKETKLLEVNTLKKSILAVTEGPDTANGEATALLEDDIKALEKKLTETQNMTEKTSKQLEEIQKLQPSNSGKLTLIGGAVALVAAIILFFLLPVAAIIFGALGIILLAVTPFLFSAYKTKLSDRGIRAKELSDRLSALKTAESNISSQLISKKIKLETVSAVQSSGALAVEQQQELLSRAEAELKELTRAEQTETNALLNFFCRYKKAESSEEIIRELEELTPVVDKQKDIKTRLNFISKNLGSISYEEARKKLTQLNGISLDPDTDFEELKLEYEELTAKIGNNKTAVATLLAELKASANEAQDPEQINKQLKELFTTINAQKSFCDATAVALEVLQESFAEIRSSYGSQLEAKAGGIFSELTQGHYGNMSISNSFDIFVSEADAFGSRELAYLSSGTADQAYLSLRLALSKLLLNGEESLPILLDDALAQYDDRRAKTALDFFKEYSKDGQIIMFTCHKSLTDSSGATVITLNEK